ncbi:blue light sensor protein [Rhodoblastus acidophilus]|uniref:Blue light sensor protein n=1 Tax=Rhodoblastus acidophilus TaxID=1074 RepID=A0A6N8DNI5_RHOAC|nr:BLUF domain-containing protein [Rhodoblastus acidophilus]MCW2275538.1 hypothetical protein [Rhodoblastus acidophilus]MTV32039.1 blue light sensor protein [Rhodoblastus acidophilus]
MTEALHRLVYHSSSRIVGADDDVDEALRDILAAARRNNPRMGVTGALMFTADSFVQVIEGPRAAVERLFQTIRSDTRHDGATLLSFGPVAERAFPHWSMAFVGGPALQRRFETFARDSGYDPARISADASLDFLQKMVRAQEQGARVAG